MPSTPFDAFDAFNAFNVFNGAVGRPPAGRPRYPFNDANGTRRTRGSTRSRSEAMTSSMSL